jgi:hypothetical protein
MYTLSLSPWQLLQLFLLWLLRVGICNCNHSYFEAYPPQTTVSVVRRSIKNHAIVLYFVIFPLKTPLHLLEGSRDSSSFTTYSKAMKTNINCSSLEFGSVFTLITAIIVTLRLTYLNLQSLRTSTSLIIKKWPINYSLRHNQPHVRL